MIPYAIQILGMHESAYIDTMNQIVDHLDKSPTVYVVGSRLSYTFAY